MLAEPELPAAQSGFFQPAQISPENFIHGNRERFAG
jgi:hypothetical protein